MMTKKLVVALSVFVFASALFFSASPAYAIRQEGSDFSLGVTTGTIPTSDGVNPYGRGYMMTLGPFSFSEETPKDKWGKESYFAWNFEIEALQSDYTVRERKFTEYDRVGYSAAFMVPHWVYRLSDNMWLRFRGGLGHASTTLSSGKRHLTDSVSYPAWKAAADLIFSVEQFKLVFGGVSRRGYTGVEFSVIFP